MPQRYFLHLAYDGTRYHGWQVQPGTLTVQSELDRALRQVLRQPELYTVGSGRTDSGVHARHQVAHFEADLPTALQDENLLLYRLRRALPADIAPLALHPVGEQVHARFDAEARTYEYHVLTRPDPFRRDQALLVDRLLDLEALNTAAAMLIGQRDFTTFSKVKGGENHYVCYCYEAGWTAVEGGFVFRIRANRFVRGMVRLVVGTLLDVGRGRLTPGEFQQLLWSLNRVDAGGAAPARGLFLSRVEYGPSIVPSAQAHSLGLAE